MDSSIIWIFNSFPFCRVRESWRTASSAVNLGDVHSELIRSAWGMCIASSIDSILAHVCVDNAPDPCAPRFIWSSDNLCRSSFGFSLRMDKRHCHCYRCVASELYSMRVVSRKDTGLMGRVVDIYATAYVCFSIWFLKRIFQEGFFSFDRNIQSAFTCLHSRSNFGMIWNQCAFFGVFSIKR